jgi:hypothetical protein
VYEPKTILKDNPDLKVKFDELDGDAALALVEFAHVPLRDEAGNDRDATFGDLADWAGYQVATCCEAKPDRVEVMRGIRGMVGAPGILFSARDVGGAWTISSRSFGELVRALCHAVGSSALATLRDADCRLRPDDRSWLTARWYVYSSLAAMERDSMQPAPTSHAAVITISEAAIPDWVVRRVGERDVVSEINGDLRVPADMSRTGEQQIVTAAESIDAQATETARLLSSDQPVEEFAGQVNAWIAAMKPPELIAWLVLITDGKTDENYAARFHELNVELLRFPEFKEKMMAAFRWLQAEMPEWAVRVGPPPITDDPVQDQVSR